MKAKPRGPFSECEFTVTGTLMRHDDTRLLELIDVILAHGAWQAANNMIVPCYVQSITLSHGRMVDGAAISWMEPGWLLAGRFMPSVDATYFLKVADMAIFIGGQMGLKSVTLHYNDQTWIYTLDENPPAKVA